MARAEQGGPDTIGSLAATGVCRGAICYLPATRWVVMPWGSLIEMCDRHADEKEQTDA